MILLSSVLATALPFADLERLGIVPVLIPLAGLGLALAGIIVGTVEKLQKRRLRHELLRVALEKGQPLPPELLQDNAPSKRGSDRLYGLINIGIGIGLIIALYALPQHALGCYWFGLIPLFIGVALLVNWALERRETDSARQP